MVVVPIDGPCNVFDTLSAKMMGPGSAQGGQKQELFSERDSVHLETLFSRFYEPTLLR